VGGAPGAGGAGSAGEGAGGDAGAGGASDGALATVVVSLQDPSPDCNYASTSIEMGEIKGPFTASTSGLTTRISVVTHLPDGTCDTLEVSLLDGKPQAGTIYDTSTTAASEVRAVVNIGFRGKFDPVTRRCNSVDPWRLYGAESGTLTVDVDGSAAKFTFTNLVMSSFTFEGPPGTTDCTFLLDGTLHIPEIDGL
jgi:hypothetical protein